MHWFIIASSKPSEGSRFHIARRACDTPRFSGHDTFIENYTNSRACSQQSIWQDVTPKSTGPIWSGAEWLKWSCTYLASGITPMETKTHIIRRQMNLVIQTQRARNILELRLNALAPSPNTEGYMFLIEYVETYRQKHSWFPSLNVGAVHYRFNHMDCWLHRRSANEETRQPLECSEGQDPACKAVDEFALSLTYSISKTQTAVK